MKKFSGTSSGQKSDGGRFGYFRASKIFKICKKNHHFLSVKNYPPRIQHQSCTTFQKLSKIGLKLSGFGEVLKNSSVLSLRVVQRGRQKISCEKVKKRVPSRIQHQTQSFHQKWSKNWKISSSCEKICEKSEIDFPQKVGIYLYMWAYFGTVA